MADRHVAGHETFSVVDQSREIRGDISRVDEHSGGAAKISAESKRIANIGDLVIPPATQKF